MSTGIEDTFESVVDSPFVIISKVPIEDPYNINNGRNEDDDLRADQFIILKTEDGTLLSFRESWADNQGGSNTGVTIELMDPDHLFLMQFIDNNSIKAFEVMVQSKEGAAALGEAYEKVDELIGDKAKIKSELSDIKDEGGWSLEKFAEGFTNFMDPDNSISEDVVDFMQRGIDNINDPENATSVFESQSSRESALKEEIEKISKTQESIYHTNNDFYITYGNGKNNLASSRLFSFAKLDFIYDAEKQGGIRLNFVHNKGQSRTAELKREREKIKGFTSEQSVKFGHAHIATLESTQTEGGGRAKLDETDDIANLMENTLQLFINKNSTSNHIPLVFLSPEVLPEIIKIIGDAKNINPIKGNKLTRTGDTTSLLLLQSRLLSLKRLLKDFGFSLDQSPPIQNYSGAIATTTDYDYYLKIDKDPNITATEQVNDIIKKIYDRLGIVIGNEICNINLNEAEHSKYFLKEFLGANGYNLITKNEKTYKNVRTVDFNGTIPSVHLIGDGYFIQGVLFNLPYSENVSVHKEYQIAQPGSNIYRFLKINYPSYLKVIRRIYVDPARKAGRFALPDEYANKQHDTVFNTLVESIPTFLANTQHSNVISFVATHSRKEQTELATSLMLPFTHTFFKDIKNDNTKILLKSKDVLSKEQTDDLIEDMVDFENYNSASMSTLLKHMDSGYNAQNSDTKEAYRKTVEGFLLNLESSDLATDNNISTHAVRSYLLYMQKLAFGVSRVKAKTTPMFYLMPEFWISKPCLFLNKKLYSPTSTFFINREGTFSGIYTILGFEHVISATECFSSFNLQRIPVATGEIDSAPPGR